MDLLQGKNANALPRTKGVLESIKTHPLFLITSTVSVFIGLQVLSYFIYTKTGQTPPDGQFTPKSPLSDPSIEYISYRILDLFFPFLYTSLFQSLIEQFEIDYTLYWIPLVLDLFENFFFMLALFGIWTPELAYVCTFKHIAVTLTIKEIVRGFFLHRRKLNIKTKVEPKDKEE